MDIHATEKDLQMENKQIKSCSKIISNYTYTCIYSFSSYFPMEVIAEN